MNEDNFDMKSENKKSARGSCLKDSDAFVVLGRSWIAALYPKLSFQLPHCSSVYFTSNLVALYWKSIRIHR